MPLYSHSRLNTYEICPLKYKLQYIDRVEIVKRKGIELFLGSRVHETMERTVDLGKLDKDVLEKVRHYSTQEESATVSQPKVVRNIE